MKFIALNSDGTTKKFRAKSYDDALLMETNAWLVIPASERRKWTYYAALGWQSSDWKDLS